MKLKLISTEFTPGHPCTCAVIAEQGKHLIVRPLGTDRFKLTDSAGPFAFHQGWRAIAKQQAVAVDGEFDTTTLPECVQDLSCAYVLSHEPGKSTPYKRLRFALNALISIAERIPDPDGYMSPVSSLVRISQEGDPFPGLDGISVLAAKIFRTSHNNTREFCLNGVKLKLWTTVRVGDGGTAIEMTIGSDHAEFYPEFVKQARRSLQRLGLTRRRPPHVTTDVVRARQLSTMRRYQGDLYQTVPAMSSAKLAPITLGTGASEG